MSARLSRRTVLLVLCCMVLLSIAWRYPLVEHERQQTDSYAMHLLASAIRDDGYAKWTFNPLSYFGYYPFSYPSGTPFILSEFSTLTGLSVEVSILLTDLLLAIIFCFAVFCLVRQFVDKPEYVLLATLFGIAGSRFVDTTYWDGSARGLSIVLMTLAVFVSFRASSLQQKRLLAIAILFGLGSFAVHHMAVLFVVFGTGYVLATFPERYLVLHAGRSRRRVVAIYLCAAGLFTVVVSFIFFSFLGSLVEWNLGSAGFFDIEPPLLSILLNIAVSFGNQIGFILFFAVLGIPSILRNYRLTTATLFPITILIVFVPLLGNPLYVSMLLCPFVAVLGTMWLALLSSRTPRKLLVMLAVVLLCASSVVLPAWSTARWNSHEQLTGDAVDLGSLVFNDANYLGAYYQDVAAVSNVYVLPIILAATTDVNFLMSGIPLVLSGDVSGSEIKANVTFSDAPFPTNLYLWYEYKDGPDANIYVLGLMLHGPALFSLGGDLSADAKDFFSRHSNLVVVIDNNWPTEFVHGYGILQAKLPSQLQNAAWDTGYPSSTRFLPSYQTYQTERVTVYVVGLPI